MKKITALTISAGTFLTFAPKAFAGTAVKPCPPNGTGFDKLCRITLSDFGSILGLVIQLAFVIAVIIALAFLIWGGIQWIVSGGDSKKVDGARNMIIGALVGLAVVFLSFFILNIVLGFFGISLSNLVIPDLNTITAS